MMPAILLELIGNNKTEAASNADLVAELKAEVDRYSAERQKMLGEAAKLQTQVKAYSAEVATLKEQVAGAAKMVEALKAENARLQSVAKHASLSNPQSIPQPSPAESYERLRQSYEKLMKDFQALKAQNAEALTSLKVLEDENEELMSELEKMRHPLNATSPRAG